MTLFQTLPRDLIEELGYILLAREIKTSLLISDLAKVYKTCAFWKHYLNNKCNCMRTADSINLFRIGLELQTPYLFNIIYRRAQDGMKINLENLYVRALIKIKDRQVLSHLICESDWKLKRQAFHDKYQTLNSIIKAKNLIFAEYYFSILREDFSLSPNYAIKSLIENNFKLYKQEINCLFAENFFILYSLKRFIFHVTDIMSQLPAPDWKYFHVIYDKLAYPSSEFNHNLLFYATLNNNVEFVKLLLNKDICGCLRKLKTIAYKRKHSEIYNIIKDKISKKKKPLVYYFQAGFLPPL